MKPLIALLLFLSAAVTSAGAAEPDAASARPNVILILADDLGFTDYGFMGHGVVQTPHLDRMAAASLLYTRGYVMPVCSPSLAALLTGRMPSVNGITGNDLSDGRSKPGQREALRERLLANSLMLPRAVTAAGYLTFQTGKLWNATYRQVGFTHGMTDTAGRHGDRGLEIGRQGMQPIFDFIRTAQAAGKPFFLWHAPMLPHDPHNPPERLLSRYRGRGPTPAAERYYAMVEWFDETTGELDAFLESNGLRDNTIILYLADNGWDAARGYQHPRAKLSPYEMGIRTPMFLRWPGRVAPARDDETPVHLLDVTKTLLDLTGATGPADLPGLNLTNRPALKARESVFVEAYTHDIADLADPSRSRIADVVIAGWWKLIEPGPVLPDRPFSGVPKAAELYDLRQDPLEVRDVSREHPEEVARLRAMLALVRR